MLENKWDEGFPASEQMIHDCDLVLDAMYTVYQAGGTIVPELANRNGNRCRKDGTGNHGGARVKGDPGKNKWLDCRALSAKENIASGILSRTIYERDNIDSLCDSELSECLNEDLSGCDNSCTSYNSGASHDE